MLMIQPERMSELVQYDALTVAVPYVHCILVFVCFVKSIRANIRPILIRQKSLARLERVQ